MDSELAKGMALATVSGLAMRTGLPKGSGWATDWALEMGKGLVTEWGPGWLVVSASVMRLATGKALGWAAQVSGLAARSAPALLVERVAQVATGRRWS